MKELTQRCLLRCSFVACSKHKIPQWRCNTKVGIGVVVMDVMIGSPVSSRTPMKKMVMDGEMTQPIDNVA